MKAIRVNGFGGPDVLRFEEVPTPQPGSGQLLVRMARPFRPGHEASFN